jgi:leucyl-tRNA synthetase
MKGDSWRMALKWLLKALAPYAPHMSEELWSQMGFEGSIHVADWPEYDEALLVENTLTIVLQVNGKLRAQIDVPVSTDQDELKQLALDNERVQEFIAGQTPKKVIVVPDRLVNIVI